MNIYLLKVEPTWTLWDESVIFSIEIINDVLLFISDINLKGTGKIIFDLHMK